MAVMTRIAVMGFGRMVVRIDDGGVGGGSFVIWDTGVVVVDGAVGR